jgi:hypothetical protein
MRLRRAQDAARIDDAPVPPPEGRACTVGVSAQRAVGSGHVVPAWAARQPDSARRQRPTRPRT